MVVPVALGPARMLMYPPVMAEYAPCRVSVAAEAEAPAVNVVTPTMEMAEGLTVTELAGVEPPLDNTTGAVTEEM